MVSDRAKKLVGGAMVVLGLVQAATGVLQDLWMYAGLGIAYAVIGVAYVWFEGYGGS